MEKSSERKTDRRTLYTKNVIKDALLELMEKKPLEKITVSDVCRTAEINRGTYYLHYYELSEVLDELLDDLLADADGLLAHLQVGRVCSSDQCSNSLCRMVRHNQKYSVLLLNEALSGRVIEKIASCHKDAFVKEITDRCGITAAQAQALFYFQITGCFAISKAGRSMDCDTWMEVRRVVDAFIDGGLEKVISESKP